MPSTSNLCTFLYFFWLYKHDGTLFFSRIAHLPIASVTLLNCCDASLQISHMWLPNLSCRPKSSAFKPFGQMSFSSVCMRPEFMTSMSCDSVYCVCGAAWSSCWLMMQLTNGQHTCVFVFVPEHTLWLSISFPCTWWTLCFIPCLMQEVMF